MSQFGDLVRELRKEKGLTLDQVAKKIGSHKGYVSGIENGKVNPPSVKFIQKFAKIFRYDEREMVRIAYVDKAPKMIRDEVRALFFARRAPAGNGSRTVEIPLLNTVESGYSARATSGGRVSPLVEETLIVPRAGDGPSCAVTVVDNSMEQGDAPSFRRGDIALLAPAERLENGAVAYVVFGDRDRKVAALRQVAIERGENVILQPFNKDYPLEFLVRDDVDAVYHVTGKIEAFEPSPATVAV